jgi:hypothetical protein
VTVASAIGRSQRCCDRAAAETSTANGWSVSRREGSARRTVLRRGNSPAPRRVNLSPSRGRQSPRQSIPHSPAGEPQPASMTAASALATTRRRKERCGPTTPILVLQLIGDPGFGNSRRTRWIRKTLRVLLSYWSLKEDGFGRFTLVGASGQVNCRRHEDLFARSRAMRGVGRVS